MACAIDIARYLIHLASPSEDEDMDCLCHLRLQKLLYYIQGWHLAAYGRPLFSGSMQAWTFGPVVREVYSAFRGYSYQVIPPKEGRDPDSLSPNEKEFIRSIWEEYKQYSSTALRDMTHREAPWLNARIGLGPKERSDEEITNQSMRDFFIVKYDERIIAADPRIDGDLWRRARQDIESGRVQTTQEIRNELRHRRAGSNQG